MAGCLCRLAVAVSITFAARPAAHMAGCLIAASPGSWVVHYTGAFLGLAALLRCTFEPGPRRLAHGLILVLAFLAMTVSGWFRATVSPSLEGSWFLAALVLVLAALAFELWTRRPGPRLGTRPISHTSGRRSQKF